MPHHSIVKSCTNRSSKPECKDFFFYSVPHSNPMLLGEWLVEMQVTQTRISEHSRICSVHFVGGKNTQKNNTPCAFPWTHRRKSPMLWPNPPSTVNLELSLSEEQLSIMITPTVILQQLHVTVLYQVALHFILLQQVHMLNCAQMLHLTQQQLFKRGKSIAWSRLPEIKSWFIFTLALTTTMHL